MNGRTYNTAATAVDRPSGPVLAWNVEPTQFPAGTYPEMPAAAAAAVSPVVPSAAAATAPPDPYGRCWQNQVDPSACFPYFGTLYGSSLPPPSYRMQPGCLSNLGQFWPPTPPPEGCVRYDGANNLHYCSPLTPVFRHGESLPQNLMGVHQRMGHYSHLIDINKDAGLKRLDSCLDSIQRQKMLLGSKPSKEVQQRVCSCYECNEKNYTRGTPQSVNKENISGGTKVLEQKYPEDKLKSKSCKRGKDEAYSHLRKSLAYQPTASAISNYTCSVEQNPTRTTMSVQGSNQSDYLVQNSQKLGENSVSNSNCVQHDFLRPESNSFPISRCATNSLITMAPSKDVTHVVQSTAKIAEQSRYDNLAEKVSRHKLHVPTSGYESCVCPPVQTPSSSSSHRSTEKTCCFSPPYVSSRTLYHNYPESSTHSKTPNMLLMYGNGYNASPLKNVYFSYYESENFDMGSGAANRKNKGSFCKLEKAPSVNGLDNHVSTPSSSQSNYVVSSANSINPGLTSNFSHGSHYDSSTVPSDSYGCVYQSSCVEQQKSLNPTYLGSSNAKRHEVPLFAEQMVKISPMHIKQEKVENTDCKFQKSHHSNNSSKLPPLSDTLTSNGALNLSTSMRCPKIEPDDQLNAAGAELVRTSMGTPVSCTLSDASIRSVSAKSAQTTSQNLKGNDLNAGYYSSVPTSAHLMKCHKVPDATTPQMHELESDCAPAVPEDLCPMAQIAPSGGAELAVLSKMPTTGYEAPVEVRCPSTDSKENCELSNSRNDDRSSLASHLFIRPERPHQKDECFSSLTYEEVCTAPNGDRKSTSLIEEAADFCSSPPEVNCKISDIGSSISPLKLSEEQKVTDTNNNKSVTESEIPLPSIKTEKEDIESFNSQATLVELSTSFDQKIKQEYECASVVTFVKSEKLGESQECLVKEELVRDEGEACDISDKKPVESTSVDECHGLYVLLQGIAHKDTVDSPLQPQTLVKDNQDANLENRHESKMNVSPAEDLFPSSDACASKMKGLNLLCALAEEQFFVEFGDVQCKSEVSANDDPVPNLRSNYPVVKEEKISAAVQSNEETSSEKMNAEGLSTELKMRKRLAELQQKYKEKQKELARLKPKKMKSLNNPEMMQLSSSTSDISCTSLNSCHVVNCSKGNNTSSCETSPEKVSSASDLGSSESGVSLVEDSPQKVAKLQKISSKGEAKSASDESCSSTSASPTETKPASGNECERSGLRGRSKSLAKSVEQRSVARRKLELRRNVRANVVSRVKAALRCSAKSKIAASNATENAIPQTESDVSDGVKRITKRAKRFSKRKNLSNLGKNDDKCNPEYFEDHEMFAAQASSKSPKKRKPENPKRFMPAKQVRLTETIVAKQLRNRILFESPECLSRKSEEKHYDVPEELFDALRKCNLGESSQSCETEKSEVVEIPELQDPKPKMETECLNYPPRNLKMTPDNLLENQRILAIEEGLFYAGSIKEVQSPEVYSIVLDGQRGNKKHLFSLEEMLTQTILELKPTSLDELPEGTRVCAYWSHQYRCLYPGTVVRAPAPSPDWSEPRVFVEFDDGDSAQIAMKNIRFLPPDIHLSEDEEMKDGLSDVPPFESKQGVLKAKGPSSDQRKRRRASKDLKKHSKLSKTDFLSSKANTSCSNDSNTEEYCGQEAPTPPPSQRLEQEQLPENQQCVNVLDTKVSKRTQKQLSKKRSGSKSKVKENGSPTEKSKKHKRYKDRHKHHHHHRHHHRHHRHCHHHRHCKKRKHHKRASNVDNIINVVIPSSSIPFSNLIAKSTRSSMKDAEAQCVGHSKKDSKQLPQPSGEMGDSKSVGTSIVKEKGMGKRESAALTR